MYEFLLNNKQIVYFVAAIFALIAFIFLYKKYKLTKYQALIFMLLTIFWVSICIVRSFRKVYMVQPLDVGGLGLDQMLAVSVVAAYGLISIFARLPIFALSDRFKSRKLFILLALIFIAISSVFVYINPNYISMLTSSLALGVGASILSLFNVMFADTFTKDKALQSVSILSIAPLFAEFLVAPIQYFFTNGESKNYGGLWLVSAIIALIAITILLFVKDNKGSVSNFSLSKINTVLKNKSFILICILGIVVSLIKFATSGANYVAFTKLTEIKMSSLGIAYLDVIFSFFQLIAGILAGIYLKKKIGVKKTLLLGLALSALFCIIPLLTTNSTILFLCYSINGFSYGLTYNVLIGLAMEPFEKNYREITMGIYQTFFAVGIYFGDKIYALIYNMLNNSNIYITNKLVFVVIGVIAIITTISVAIFFKGKNNKFIES